MACHLYLSYYTPSMVIPNVIFSLSGSDPGKKSKNIYIYIWFAEYSTKECFSLHVHFLLKEKLFLCSNNGHVFQRYIKFCIVLHQGNTARMSIFNCLFIYNNYGEIMVDKVAGWKLFIHKQIAAILKNRRLIRLHILM